MDDRIVIKNGRIYIADQKSVDKADILVVNGKIAEIATAIPADDGDSIDASDCLVTPGLIDYHAHLFAGVSDHGVWPDASMLPNGVTFAVDAGTSGASTYAAMKSLVLDHAQIGIRSFLNVSSFGMINDRIHEDLQPEAMNLERIASLFEQYPSDLLGLKLRFSLDICPNMKPDVLYRALEMAERLSTRLVVHVTNPAMDIEQLALSLRSGDVFCHMYQGKGQSIVTESGKVRKGIREAREKGVLFDACNGRSNFSAPVAQAAIEDGFLPDVISTDLTVSTLYRHPVISLPYILSKYLAMGMALGDVLAAVTKTPASLMGLEPAKGSLRIGGDADIAIFKNKRLDVVFRDFFGNAVKGNELLVPQITILNGRVAYRQTDF